jgi:hypothetical protein
MAVVQPVGEVTVAAICQVCIARILLTVHLVDENAVTACHVQTAAGGDDMDLVAELCKADG